MYKCLELMEKQTIPLCRKRFQNKQYHTVGNGSKTNNTTLSETVPKSNWKTIERDKLFYLSHSSAICDEHTANQIAVIFFIQAKMLGHIWQRCSGISDKDARAYPAKMLGHIRKHRKQYKRKGKPKSELISNSYKTRTWNLVFRY